jgi:hypothetical protein
VPDIDVFSSGKTGECIPLFHYEQRVDPEESEKAGHPVYKDVEYVQIIAPGNDKEVVNKAVTKAEIERWPDQYKRFKSNEKMTFEGTPINEWPQVTKAQAKTLEAMHIYTVEQLAEVADRNIGNLGIGVSDLKNKAKAYLEWQAGESSVQKYAQQKRRLEEKNAELNERVAKLEEQIAALLDSKETEVAPEVAPAASTRKKRGSAK